MDRPPILAFEHWTPDLRRALMSRLQVLQHERLGQTGHDISREDIEAELAAAYPGYTVEDPEFHQLCTAASAYVAQLGGLD
jgi:hypothetical protein